MNMNEERLIPEISPLYVKFGHYEDIKSIVASKIFYPIFITGLSGNGKTFMVDQICAELKREMFRVNVTIETDEDDLLGGFRLVNGETVWFDGPVVKAMQRGTVLLLDEVDLASTKIMCLQPVLEGSGVFLKKINKFIKPAHGFTVVATANTKGQGSESGKFIGTNVLNEAFLERFPATFEQEYPGIDVEKTILRKAFLEAGVEELDELYMDNLLKWAEQLRNNFQADTIEDLISTRRLVQIARAYAIFRDGKKAIEVCISRFDETTKNAFRQFYDNVATAATTPATDGTKEKKPRTIREGNAVDVASVIGAHINPNSLTKSP